MPHYFTLVESAMYDGIVAVACREYSPKPLLTDGFQQLIVDQPCYCSKTTRSG